jgi:hypothetical protein
VPSDKITGGTTSRPTLLKDAKRCHEAADICAVRMNLHAGLQQNINISD